MNSERSKAIRVFVSFSHVDQPLLKMLFHVLGETFTTWTFTSDLEAGQLWAPEIIRAIQECHVVLLVASSVSVRSLPVGNEFDFAEYLGKAIIPILLDKTGLPSKISKYQYIEFDVRNSQQVDEIVQAIRERYIAAVVANRTRADYREPPFSFNDPHHSFGPLHPLSTQPSDKATVDLDMVFQAGNKAYVERDIERAMELWNSVLLVQPSYQRGDLRKKVNALQVDLRKHFDRQIEARQAELKDAETRHEDTLHAWEDLNRRIKKYEQAGYTNTRALKDVLDECVKQAARIGNWDKALDYLRELEHMARLGRERRRKARRQRRALLKNQDVVELYDQARLHGRAQEDSATEDALRQLYKRASAYGDPDGLIGQLVSKRMVQKEAERARIIRMREQIEEQQRKRLREHPFSARVAGFFTSVSELIKPKEPLPTIPPPVTREGVEREIQEEVWPPPTRYLRLSTVPCALLASSLKVLRGIRNLVVLPFRALQEEVDWIGILAVLLYYGFVAAIGAIAASQLGIVRLAWSLGALLVLVFIVTCLIDFVRGFVRGEAPFDMRPPEVFETLFD